MKRLPILLILLALFLGAPVLVSGLSAAVDDTAKVVKEHELIKEKIQNLLNRLRKLAETETDEKKKQQYEAVLKYAESGETDLLGDMGIIIEMLNDQENVDAAAKDQTLLARLDQIELLLKGYDLDLDTKLANLKAIIAALRVIHAEMNEILKQMPSTTATMDNIKDAIKDVNKLEQAQKDILDKIQQGGDYAKQDKPQDKLQKETEKLTEQLKAMAGGKGAGKDGKASKAEAAAAKAAGSAGAAGAAMKAAGKAMSGSGGKGQAQAAGEEAKKQLAKTKKALEEALDEAVKKAKSQEYKLKKLAERQRALAEKLKKLQDKAKLSDASNQAKTNIAKAREATEKSAKGNSGQGGKPGPPGPPKDSEGKGKSSPQQAQKDAKKALEEAIKDLEKDYALMNQIKKLMEIKKVLEAMIKRQEAIYDTTNNLYQYKEDIRKKALEKNVKLRDEDIKFDRSQLTELNEIKDDEEGLSRTAGMMSKLLNEDGKHVFVYMLKKVEANMNEVVVLLDEQNVKSGTLSLENRILRDLQMLRLTLQDELDSLKEQQQKKKKPNKPQEAKKKKQKPQLLPKLAEIKLLKFLEETIKSDTEEINKEYQAPMPSYKKKIKARLCERLSTKQAEVAELTKAIIEELKKQKK